MMNVNLVMRLMKYSCINARISLFYLIQITRLSCIISGIHITVVLETWLLYPQRMSNTCFLNIYILTKVDIVRFCFIYFITSYLHSFTVVSQVYRRVTVLLGWLLKRNLTQSKGAQRPSWGLLCVRVSKLAL